ncbi:Isopenicillin N synthase [Corchorus capsularis]|uniref:Isopenicillin N synthase n=1 Tax=Corchorus capsularis TaxID=210143 RepID=A0A1R3G808_COCAP|nr:Isopenicillin N synthase [Corchorus capsularis]
MSSVRLPVIDFSKQDLKPGTPEWDVLKVQVREALTKYGCFEASTDRLKEVGKPIIGAMEEIFDLPLEYKKRCVFDSIFGGHTMAPLNETFHIDNWNVADQEYIQQHLTNILWPQGNPNFSKTLLCFRELASGLDKTIRTMILESFGLDHKYIKEHIDLTTYNVRLMKYEGQPQSNDAPGLAPHFDQNLLSLLYQNGVNGLEIQKNDGEWIKVKCAPDSFIVIIGESLGVLLNGRLPSPYHRVRNVGNDKTRYSAGFFSMPKGGRKVKVPEEVKKFKDALQRAKDAARGDKEALQAIDEDAIFDEVAGGTKGRRLGLGNIALAERCGVVNPCSSLTQENQELKENIRSLSQDNEATKAKQIQSDQKLNKLQEYLQTMCAALAQQNIHYPPPRILEQVSESSSTTCQQPQQPGPVENSPDKDNNIQDEDLETHDEENNIG